MKRIILASQSPRRKQLLQWAEVPFDVVLKETDESYPDGLEPADVAVHIARNKALAIRSLYGDETPILAADTIVVLHGEIIGKPSDREDAINILTRLSGQDHEVITGVCILYNNKENVFYDSTAVKFHDLSTEQITFYIDNYKPYDKAGAYAIQEWIGVIGIKSISGDFYNVMGLPVSRVVKTLNSINL
jgi:septum formation protein